jgi:hypothetical protein
MVPQLRGLGVRRKNSIDVTAIDRVSNLLLHQPELVLSSSATIAGRSRKSCGSDRRCILHCTLSFKIGGEHSSRYDPPKGLGLLPRVRLRSRGMVRHGAAQAPPCSCEFDPLRGTTLCSSSSAATATCQTNAAFTVEHRNQCLAQGPYLMQRLPSATAESGGSGSRCPPTSLGAQGPPADS